MRRAPRVPRVTTDADRIVAAIDRHLPATPHHSWALSREHGCGSYMKIGGMNVLKSDWDRLLAERGIVMAEHYRETVVGWKTKVFDWRLIKSRFGETKVARYLQGGVRSCDNEEAKRFYDAQQAASVAAICASINAGDLEEAKETKRAFKRTGQYL